jgi:hypothetical protein
MNFAGRSLAPHGHDAHRGGHDLGGRSRRPAACQVRVWSGPSNGAAYVLVGNDGSGHMWAALDHDWETRACPAAGRTLSRIEWQQFLPDRQINQPAHAARAGSPR